MQTHGTITLEGNPGVIAAGAPVYHAGNYMCWGDADVVSLGTLYLVQSIGWGGGGGEGLGDLGVNAVLAPVQMKLIIGERGAKMTTIPNPFSPLGKLTTTVAEMWQLCLTVCVSVCGQKAIAVTLGSRLSYSQSRLVR